MFGGVLTILVAIWVFRAAQQAKTGKVLLWAAGSAVLFFAVQTLFYNINIFIIDGLGSDVGGEYDRDLTSVGDRKDGGGIQDGFFGSVLGVLFEIFPLFMGLLSVALVRTKYILKAEITAGNLVSGIKEVFTGIANSFKTN
jgi:hypothetical protein